MLVFDLTREQEFRPDLHVEKILATVAGGVVTVACWEPGQISPNHCHPEATEIYFCFGDACGPRDHHGRHASYIRGVPTWRAARLRERAGAHAAFRVRYGTDVADRRTARASRNNRLASRIIQTPRITPENADKASPTRGTYNRTRPRSPTIGGFE
jgi:hypothetical protein